MNSRENWQVDLRKKIDRNENYCWIHCASAGEFEQAIPLIKRIKNNTTDNNPKIAVSFFSPSGFEMYKNSGFADVFFYFPLDTKTNAQKLIDILHPEFVIFIRNEIWLNTLNQLKKKNIPTFLANVNIEQKRNFIYQKYLNHAYPLFTQIFDTKTFGHTKLEKVISNKNEVFNDTVLDNFCKESFVIILGSSWFEEERFIVDFYKKHKERFPNLRIIIAPHENLSFNSLTLKDKESIAFYSSYQASNILVIDKKGILKYAYRHADIAIIGGGFGKGVHNVAEAAVYGIPTLFGANYIKFEETIELTNLQVAFPVNNYDIFEKRLLELMNNVELRNNIKIILNNYFSNQEHASTNIIDSIRQHLK